MEFNSSFTAMLQTETSRRNADIVANIIVQKPELFEELFQIFKSNTEPVSRRAAWVIDNLTEKHPEFIAPLIDDIIEMLSKFRHNGLKRHSMKILARSPLPQGDHLGVLIKTSFEWLLSQNESIAVKVYCMELLYRISRIEPDIKKELADTIEWRMNEESAGFRNRGQKILRNLNLEIDHSLNAD